MEVQQNTELSITEMVQTDKQISSYLAGWGKKTYKHKLMLLI